MNQVCKNSPLRIFSMKLMCFSYWLVLALVTVCGGSNIPSVYQARVVSQCDNHDTLNDEKLMQALDIIQQQLQPQEEKVCVYLNCKDAYQKGRTISGVYTINPDNQTSFRAYCDMVDTDGGGWTVFQRRMDGSVDFYLNWADYEQGFGDLNGEYWLGLRNIHRLTSSTPQELRVDLEDFEDQTRYAFYSSFSLTGADDKYCLMVSGYRGTAGNSLSGFNQNHSRRQFTTKDEDNDAIVSGNCAVSHRGAWWYRGCHDSNLNGLYLNGPNSAYADGINWRSYEYSLKSSQMKTRPK